MSKTEKQQVIEQASAIASEAVASGEKSSPAMTALASKVIGMIEKRSKGEEMTALMVEARKAYGLPPK